MENTLIPSGTVVVGIDDSSTCERALEWAVDHAVRERRQLTLAHGFDPARADVHDLMRLTRERVLDLAPDLAVHEARWPSDPRVMLAGLATEAALVVVGSHGRGPVGTAMFGSVGVALARRATCPVVVVRPHHPGVVRNGVIVGLDATQRCRPVLEFAYRQASLRELPLTILHAAAAADALIDVAEAVAGLAEKFPDVRVRTEVTSEDPAAVLARESRRMDLVVLGAHRGGVLQPSVTSSVLEHASCPVAVVPLPMGGSEA